MFGMSGFRRKPRQYSYKPLYFDPDKEERDARRRLKGQDLEEKDDKPYVPGSLLRTVRSQRIMGIEPNDKEMDKERMKRVITRLVIFLFILILLGYGLMSSDFIEVFLSMGK